MIYFKSVAKVIILHQKYNQCKKDFSTYRNFYGEVGDMSEFLLTFVEI